MSTTEHSALPFGQTALERRISRALVEEERRLVRAIRERRGLELSDRVDLASETFERQVDFGLIEDFRSRLDEVAAAQQRLASGRYGQCQRCGGVVDADRLTALPATPWCRECAGRLERQAGWLDSFRGDRRGVLVSSEFLLDDDAGPDSTGQASQEEAAVTVRHSH